MLNGLWQVLIRLDHDWTKTTWKEIWKRYEKSNIWKPWMLEILPSFLDLNHSIYDQHHNPNHPRLQAALRTSLQNCKNSQKVEFWNQGYRAIQGIKPIAIASLGDSERVPIININSEPKTWYMRVKLFTKISIIISWILRIFHVFSSLICTN